MAIVNGEHVAPIVGVPVAYRIYGNPESGKPVYVILHGRGSWGGEFYGAARELAADGYPVIVLDLPGHGHSGMPSLGDPSLWKLDTLAEAVYQVVVGHLGVGKFRLFGHSLGGVVALEYLKHHWETVETIYTMGTHYEIASLSRPAVWLDRFVLRTPLRKLARRFVWYRSREVARRMRGLIEEGGGDNHRRDLAILEQIDTHYDYREDLQRFLLHGKGKVVLIYATGDKAINAGMEKTIAFIRGGGKNRRLVEIPGGHHGHVVDPWPLAKALIYATDP